MNLKETPSVGIIAIWLGGKFPSFYDLWITSCAANPTIDFLLFTDQEVEELPSNVKFIKFSISAFSNMASEKLCMKIRITKSYKLCDFRPAFGLLFKDYLLNYDYWGHCDFDLIWGDIRYFLTEYTLHEYDRFLERGHLILYKNVNAVNNLFKCKGSKTGDYKFVFSSELNWGFDETKGMNEIVQKNNIKCFNKLLSADISVMHLRLQHTYCIDDIDNFENQVFCYDKGRIYQYYYEGKDARKKEFLCIHLQSRKGLKVLFDYKKANSFWITNKGFVEKKEDISLTLIEKLNPYKNKQFEDYEKKDYFRKHWKVPIRGYICKFYIGRTFISFYYKRIKKAFW